DFKARGDAAATIGAQIEKANVLMTIGALQQAIALLEHEVVPAINKDEKRILWVRATQILANAYFRAGMYREARELNERTLVEIDEVEQELPRIELELDSANLRAMLLGKLGQPKES